MKHGNYYRSLTGALGADLWHYPTGNCRENVSIGVVVQLQIMKKRANYELTGDGGAVPCYYPSDDCRGRVLIGVIFQLHYPK